MDYEALLKWENIQWTKKLFLNGKIFTGLWSPSKVGKYSQDYKALLKWENIPWIMKPF